MNPMKIISRYVREQRRYSKNELRNLFVYDEQGVEQFIRCLKAYSILKSVKNNIEQLNLSELVDEDVQIADERDDNDEFLYVFTYVGIITYGNRIIKVYPKYLLSVDKPLIEMKQIIKVLERYSHSKEQILNLCNGDGEVHSFNFLAIILFLLNDYHEYGVYNNSEDIIELNGEGAILWENTINNSFPFIRDNRPYYTELYTKKTIDDDTDYFKRLHECILTECSKWLQESQLDELFEIVSLDLSEDSLDFFGDKEYILDRIQAELNLQFNTRKQILLKTMYTYILKSGRVMEEIEGISLYGTKAFNMVWEKACSEIFDNHLDTPLGNLALPKQIENDDDRKKMLKQVIEKPKWESNDVFKIAAETLIPDIVTIRENKLIILDAKYYNLQLEKGKPLRGNPGIGDVTKQYLYQLAYKDFMEAHDIKIVRNCFLMPTEQSEIIEKGTVKLEMLESLKLENIQIRLLPAYTVFEHYLKGEKFSIDNLEL